MEYSTLGRTGISVSAISFGSGPISTHMVGDQSDRQRATVKYALEKGINWFDTAATYGAGASETNLGCVLADLGATSRIHVATKVRLMPDDLNDIRSAVRRSIEGSLQRLRLRRVTLCQLHNSITLQRGDEPTSVTPADVLCQGGIFEALQELQAEGLVQHLGLTGIGQPAALAEVVHSGLFQTIQAPYHLLNPSAGCVVASEFPETNYGNIIADCTRENMGVFAIRVLAGGALAGNPPSPHTFKTPFFPLDLYERDRQRAALLQERLGETRRLPRKQSASPWRILNSTPRLWGLVMRGRSMRPWKRRGENERVKRRIGPNGYQFNVFR